MTVSEMMQSYCVKVNGGSGVLVNAMTRDYSYVLTAAHVITDENKVNDYQDNPIKVLSVFIPPQWSESQSDQYDFAVLKVDYQERVLQNCLPASDLTDKASLTLVGFPITERDTTNPIKEYTGHKINVADQCIIMFLDGIAGTEEIRGMSGGGVYHIQNEKPLLIGVEFKMDRKTIELQYGRTQNHSLSRFEEIIAAHSGAPMIPEYLECFSRVRDLIFPFNVIKPNNIQMLKNALVELADKLIGEGLPKPYRVMEDYKSELLANSANLNELKTRQLWVAYLEFLVISVLMDNSAIADDDYIKGLKRKRRLLYTSDTKNWVSNLEELLKVARKLLDRDGTLIIASPDVGAMELPPDFHLEDVISDIANISSQGPLAIDKAERDIYTSYKLTHLEGLRNKCLIKGEFEYSKLKTKKQQLKLFRDKLSEIIK
jgi:hypothetical protein